jgi:hypothetical protein
MHSIASLMLAFLTSTILLGQTTFTNVNSQIPGLINTQGLLDGCGVSMVDFNADGWDDLSFATANDGARFFTNEDGSFAEVDLGIAVEENGKMITWVDFDNDGDKDLFLTHRYGRCKLYRNDDGIFVDISTSTGFPQDSEHLTTGAGWADYDRDGLLDVYICNFNSPFGNENVLHNNYLFRNLGDGTFEDVSLAANVHNGAQQTYQMVWFDYNNDSWPDMYVINDRLFHSNSLYHNNGDGTFSDVALASGTDISIYAMSATAFDYNSDGWQDLYITNGIEGNAFFQNNSDGTFTDISAITGTQGFSVCWAASILDHDNNGYQDIHVAVWASGFPVQQNHFWTYEGGLNFTYSPSTFPDNTMQGYSSAVGDINNDGFTDMVMHNDAPYQASLWQCDGNDNHFIKLHAEGTLSNRDAIGTLFELSSAGGTQYRYTKCGEDYMTQNSTCDIVGLGSDTIVESITVTWPSGLIEEYFDLTADSSYTFIEGNTINMSINASATEICSNDTAFFSTILTDGVTWSNGSETSSIEAFIGDTISYVHVTQGITFYSDTIIVQQTPSAELNISSTDLTCYNDQSGEISIQSINGVGIQSVLINNEVIELPATGLNAGITELLVNDSNGCSQTAMVELHQPDSLYAEMNISSPSCYGLNDGELQINLFGGTLPYSIDSVGLDFSQMGAGEYAITVIDSSACSFIVELEIEGPAELILEVEFLDDFGDGGSADAEATGGTGTITPNWSTGSSEWSANNLPPGDYWVSVTDSLGCTDSTSFQILNLGIEIGQNDVFSVYPVPSEGFLNIISPKQCVILIYDDLGKNVSNHNLNKGVNSLNISHFPPGAYFIMEKKSGTSSIKPSTFLLVN